jgi:hypothetical protein
MLVLLPSMGSEEHLIRKAQKQRRLRDLVSASILLKIIIFRRAIIIKN